MRVASPIVLNPEQKQELEQCARARSRSARLVERARIVLLAASGKQDKEVAEELGITAHKVARWRQRFLAAGMAGLEKDAPRPGRTPSISPAKVKQVIHKTTQARPAQGTHWSTRTMAAAVGLSAATVRRIWRKHGLKPHRMDLSGCGPSQRVTDFVDPASLEPTRGGGSFRSRNHGWRRSCNAARRAFTEAFAHQQPEVRRTRVSQAVA